MLVFLYNEGLLYYKYSDNYRKSDAFSFVGVDEINHLADDPRILKYHLQISWNGITLQEFPISQESKTKS